MNFSPPAPPDLASILRTLSAYAPSPLQQPTSPSTSPDLEDGEYDPSEYDPCVPLLSITSPTSPCQSAFHGALPGQSTTTSTTITTPKPKPSPIPDPSIIKTYPAALRHITTYIVPNPQASHRLHRLIQSQREHERQWWSARQELVRKIEGREEGRRKLDSVLASVGGLVAGNSGNAAAAGELERDEGEREIKVFEKKVWKAQAEMVKAAEKELRALGVPGFVGAGGADGSRGEGKGAVGLRQKVIGLLEDLFEGEEGG